MQFFVVLNIFLKACGLALALLLLRVVIWLVNMLVVLPASDPLRKIPGHQGTFFQSSLDDVLDPHESSETHNKWRNLYGNTFRFHGFGKYDYRLMTFDFRAISQILTSPVYEKPWQTRTILGRLIGRGIISMEGHEHKAQRKLMGPAFSSQSIKDLAPIFLSKAEDLCDIWEKDLQRKEDDSAEEQPTALDVCSGLLRAAFDAVGLSGFDYDFKSLQDDSRPDHQPYRAIFRVVDQGIGLRDILDLYVPALRIIWPSKKTVSFNKSHREVQNFGRKLIERKKAKILAGDSSKKDILGLLVKASLSSSTHLSDNDLLDQCSTFLFAGSDSVAIGLSWALHQLATNPDVQSRLYQELKGSQQAKGLDEYDSDRSDDSGYVEEPALRASSSRSKWAASLESLPYLETIVRETLRLSPPVHSTIRVATADDEIIFTEPVLVDGRLSNSIKIRKGTYVHIPIEGINYSEDIWGPDALEFKPERWNKLPEGASALPGLGNILTFGYGPHSCLGHRFAITEMKAFLATMVLRFEFTPVEGLKIKRWNSFVTRPYVASVGRSKSQLPLHFSRR